MKRLLENKMILKNTNNTFSNEGGEDDDDDDEIQDVTPANIKTKSEESSEPTPPPRSAPRNASDDLMGLPMEPTGLEGGGKILLYRYFKVLKNIHHMSVFDKK